MKYIIALLLFTIIACDKETPKPEPSPQIQPAPSASPSPSPVPPAPIPTPQPPEVLPPCGMDIEEKSPVHPVLINGAPANIKDWPASVYASAGSSRCSSTVVGERTLFSAGHCMSNSGTVSFSVGSNKYIAKCTHHPEYKKNDTADWALCLVDKPVIGIKYENFAKDFSVKKGDVLRLTGYGCTKPNGTGGNDGIFRIGLAKVTSVPFKSNYDVALIDFKDSFEVTPEERAALCYGDSGGAGYKEHENGDREIFGVNSRGDIRTTSYLPAVGLPVFRDFAKDWALKNNTKICGIHDDAKDCRTVVPPIPPPPKYDFEVNSKVSCVRGKIHKGHEAKKPTIIEKIKQTLNGII